MCLALRGMMGDDGSYGTRFVRVSSAGRDEQNRLHMSIRKASPWYLPANIANLVVSMVEGWKQWGLSGRGRGSNEFSRGALNAHSA